MYTANGLECVKGYDSLFKDISFSLNSGEILQVQGTNGSGKTSLLRILTGLSQAEAGTIYWQDNNIEDDLGSFHQNLLYIGHQNGLKAGLSALENLNLSRQYLDNSTDITPLAALEAVGLGGYEPILAHQLSAGQKRRVALAKLLLSKASLWILDEPITAIDVDGVGFFQDTIKTHVRAGGMVILTSHQNLNFGAQKVRTIQINSA